MNLDDFDDKLIRGANRLVSEMDKRNISAYVTLAKIALWLAAAVISSVLLVAILDRDLPLTCQASQVLVVLAVSVLGFHEYRGSRILHVLRNLRPDNK